ncbi:MAG: 50S ribosomal protein L16 [Bacteroidetes bacterium]|nr:50S ribosomal protein L16 [Bacteroidota bacterium]
MLQPQKTKWRNVQKGGKWGTATRGHQLAFGSFGLKALAAKWITDKQIEAARVALTRHLKREGQVWIRIFPDKPVTKKPAEVRMGSGKGALDHWVAPVKSGTILFEIEGVTLTMAKEAFRLASHKLPIKTKLTIRPDYLETVS